MIWWKKKKIIRKVNEHEAKHKEFYALFEMEDYHDCTRQGLHQLCKASRKIPYRHAKAIFDVLADDPAEHPYICLPGAIKENLQLFSDICTDIVENRKLVTYRTLIEIYPWFEHGLVRDSKYPVEGLPIPKDVREEAYKRASTWAEQGEAGYRLKEKLPGIENKYDEDLARRIMQTWKMATKINDDATEAFVHTLNKIPEPIDINTARYLNRLEYQLKLDIDRLERKNAS